MSAIELGSRLLSYSKSFLLAMEFCFFFMPPSLIFSEEEGNAISEILRRKQVPIHAEVEAELNKRTEKLDGL